MNFFFDRKNTISQLTYSIKPQDQTRLLLLTDYLNPQPVKTAFALQMKLPKNNNSSNLDQELLEVYNNIYLTEHKMRMISKLLGESPEKFMRICSPVFTSSWENRPMYLDQISDSCQLNFNFQELFPEKQTENQGSLSEFTPTSKKRVPKENRPLHPDRNIAWNHVQIKERWLDAADDILQTYFVKEDQTLLKPIIKLQYDSFLSWKTMGSIFTVFSKVNYFALQKFVSA